MSIKKIIQREGGCEKVAGKGSILFGGIGLFADQLNPASRVPADLLWVGKVDGEGKELTGPIG